MEPSFRGNTDSLLDYRRTFPSATAARFLSNDVSQVTHRTHTLSVSEWQCLMSYDMHEEAFCKETTFMFINLIMCIL